MSGTDVNELVRRLMETQAVVADGGRHGTTDGFKEAIDRGYVQIKFTETRGGTNLGVRLDKQYCDYANADWAAGTGIIKLGGELTLNYENVRLLAEINISSLRGEGHLEYLGPSEEWRKKKMQPV